MTWMNRLAATLGLVALVGAGLVATTTTVLAHSGDVYATQTCTAWSAEVYLDNNVTYDRTVDVVTTISGMGPITGGHYNTSDASGLHYTAPTNAEPDSPVTYGYEIIDGTGPGNGAVTGSVTLNIWNGSTLEYTASASLVPASDCAPPPTTTTTTTVASAGGVQGTSVTDTVTVAPGTATGTVTFKLYGPSTSTTPSCSDDLVFTSPAETLSGGKATSPGFAPTEPGIYYWTASYTPASGSVFASSSSGCGVANESVIITAPPPPPPPPTTTTTTTVASAGGVQGTSVTDTVTVAPGTGSGVPTGTVTFSLYGPSATVSCSDDLVFTSSAQTLSGGKATSPDFAPTSPGTYYWTASYTPASGSVFASSSSECGAANESVIITAPPPPPPTPQGSGVSGAQTTSTATQVRDARGDVNPSPAVLSGDTVWDTATVVGAAEGIVPTGTVTYSFFHNASCSSATATDTVTLIGGVVPNSASATLTVGRSYSFDAVYNGDVNDTASTSSCEPFSVLTPTGSVSAASTATPTTGADLFLPGLLAAFASLFGGLLLMAGVRLRRRPIV
jgi:hypothetical protein